MGRNNKKSSPRKGSGTKTKAVDMVTGKATIEYYFDPGLVMSSSGSSVSAPGGGPDGISSTKKSIMTRSLSTGSHAGGVAVDVFFASKHLFMPCTIVKPLMEDDKASSIAGNKSTLSSSSSSSQLSQQQPFAGPTLVKTADGTLHKIEDSTKLIPLRAPHDYVGMDDVLHLPHITEASLLHTVRTRYKRDEIYTTAGPILISINPYKSITTTVQHQQESIYSERQMDLYYQQSMYKGSIVFAKTTTTTTAATTTTATTSTTGGADRRLYADPSSSLPPHLFQVANRAYVALMESLLPAKHPGTNPQEEDAALLLMDEHSMNMNKIRDQSIIISGESGSGKTEATKIIMKFLAHIANQRHQGMTNRHHFHHNNRHRNRGNSSSSPTAHHESPPTTDPMIVTHSNPDTNIDGITTAATTTLEDRVLSSNPLLETFGNACTLRNDNSSRFGKCTRIYFGLSSGMIQRARISNYLLEKTRVTTQVDGERNYHIFYQVLAAADGSLLEKLHLQGGISSFRYLGNRSCSTSSSSSTTMTTVPMDSNSSVNSSKDAKDFEETCRCLTSLGLTGADQDAVFSMVAAILHLGNIEFEERGDGDDDDAKGDEDEGVHGTSKIADRSLHSLHKACDLLGLDQDQLSQAMLTKLLNINGKVIKTPQSVAMATDKRDALAMMTYSCLLLWLVSKINAMLDESATTKTTTSFDEDDEDSGYIGVLDIYGFECFEVNGYEQLLINYCNEKLQRHFNRHLFEVEQELYASEGVDWTYITFNDNRPCLELIEGGGSCVGILNLLDDAWGGMGTTAEKDAKFVTHLHKNFATTQDSAGTTSTKKNGGGMSDSTTTLGASSGSGSGSCGHKHFITPKFGKDRQFIILHYAGEVRYTADGFVEKNMDTLSNELRDLGEDATKPLSQAIYKYGNDGLPQRSSIRGVSVGSQFRSSLQTLVDHLESTQPHYVRCFKPNLSKAPNSFMSGEVLKQLRYSGMMEAIRIRREGYAYREDHESFFNRFSILLSSSELDNEGESAGIEQLVQVLSERLNVTEADWQIGHTKIFLRRELAEKLDRLAMLRVYAASRTLSRFGRHVAQARVARLLVAWVRYRLHMLRKYRSIRSSDLISSTFRRFRQERVYRSLRRAFVMVQAAQRRRIAKQQVRKLRDPYCDMSFRQCQRLLRDKENELESAVASKDFRTAVRLEVEIVNVKEAIERKRPLTRAVLDVKIEAIQQQLDNAVERKAYAECGPLQDQLDDLLSKRGQLPTTEELQETVRMAEEKMAEAAKNRDFRGAAESQAKVDEARKRLAEHLAAEEDPPTEHELDPMDLTNDGNFSVPPICKFESRFELEEAISDISAQLKAAIDAKDFGQASKLQQLVEKWEQLREVLPTLAELEATLAGHKARLEDAIAGKEFGSASSLNETIAVLESRIQLENDRTRGGEIDSSKSAEVASARLSTGEEVTFECRGELEQEISKVSAVVSKCVSGREFKKADQFQGDVDRLTELRNLLPSLKELQDDLATRKKEMNAAIASKQFSKADEINLVVEKLELKVAKEKAAAPAPQTPAQKGIATPVRKDAAKSTVASKLVQNIQGPTMQAVEAPIKQAVVAPVLPSVPSHPTRSASVTKSLRIASDPPSVKTMPVQISSNQSRASVRSINTTPAPKSHSKAPVALSATFSRPVSKLRPAIPLLSKADDSILSVAQMLASKRSNATVIVSPDGHVAGILTDTDVTRRVVAKYLDPASSPVADVMTPNPSCVSMSDFATDALSIMVENHFRHLPVINGEGSVVGLLDIAKCLNDAINKLERVKDKGSNATDDVLKQVISQQGAGGAQAAALQALLGSVMTQAFGNKSMPTLRSILADRPSTIVKPDSSIREAGLLMAERRKASLVVDDSGRLVGIFGFKDMMTRAIAKELPLDTTPVSQVMTPSPDAATPDMSVLDALQSMHDNHFLTLPVCEEDGTVVGIVDVMDVIYGCGGADGWRSIFSKSMEAMDDVSDVSSVASFQSKRQAPASAAADKVQLSAVDESKDERPVSKLRPSKPIVVDPDQSVLEVAQLLASKRSDASLIANPDGGLLGILTDKDVTRRLVAKHRDSSTTSAHDIMTPNPKCVSLTDSAMEALTIMVESRIRHLPVTDESGAIVGILDITRCLRSAIGKLERKQDSAASTADAMVKQVLGDQVAGSAALQALLGSLMTEAFGKTTVPTLRSILAGRPSTMVRPSASIREVGVLMADNRKAALIVDDWGQLVGIFGFKDMMTRAVAKDLPLDETEVSVVMTPNPEFVSPDMSVLEALQAMHDNKFLTLPVCESDGTVVGLVDVMDVIYGCGGSEGWRSIFSSAMDANDDASEIGSVKSSGTSKHVQPKKKERTVAKLRPSKPNIAATDDVVLSVCQMLQSKRSDAALVVNSNGALAGILTDKDITRRVVAKYLDPSTTEAAVVMTPNPHCVSITDSATDAMMTMVENHFRHLPVVDARGSVVGLLDIAKCLNDAIDKLESVQERNSAAADNVVKQMVNQGAGGAHSLALQALLGNLVSEAMGSQASPSLRSLLAGKPRGVVRPDSTIREAAIMMAEINKSVLVVDEDNQLVGIFGFKDMMVRAVSRDLPFDSTDVSEVMTPGPETASPDMTALDALQTMHDLKFLTLPVCESNGTVVGLVDVMDVILGCGGAEGWKSIFSSALDLDDGSDAASAVLSRVTGPGTARKSRGMKSSADTPSGMRLPGNIPATLEFEDPDGHESFNGSTIDDDRKGADDLSVSGIGGALPRGIFKITDPLGKTHRVRCETRILYLLDALVDKTGISRKRLQVHYIDEEGDPVVISSDDDLTEAWSLARKSGKRLAKLTAKEVEPKSDGLNPMLLVGISVGVAIAGLVLFALSRPKKI